MRECSKVQENLSAYLDDELPPEQREAIQAHLAVCPACRQELARLTRLWEALAALPSEPPPEGLVEQVLARLAGRKAPRRRSLALAASVLLGVFLGGTMGVNLYEALQPPAAETQVLALEDFKDFPPGSLGTFLATYRLDEDNAV